MISWFGANWWHRRKPISKSISVEAAGAGDAEAAACLAPASCKRVPPLPLQWHCSMGTRFPLTDGVQQHRRGQSGGSDSVADSIKGRSAQAAAHRSYPNTPPLIVPQAVV